MRTVNGLVTMVLRLSLARYGALSGCRGAERGVEAAGAGGAEGEGGGGGGGETGAREGERDGRAMAPLVEVIGGGRMWGIWEREEEGA